MTNSASPHRALLIIGHVLLGAVLGTGLALVFGLGVQFLWNDLMPGLFHVPALTFKQAVAMIILARLLFGRFGSSGKKHHGWLHRHHQHARGAATHTGCRCWSRPACGCAEADTDIHS